MRRREIHHKSVFGSHEIDTPASHHQQTFSGNISRKGTDSGYQTKDWSRLSMTRGEEAYHDANQTHSKIKSEIGTKERSERKFSESKLSSGYERLKYLRMQFAICNAYSDSEKHKLIYDIPDSQKNEIISDIARETTGDAFLNYTNGDKHYENNQYKKALKAFKKAIELNSNNIEYYSHMISTPEKFDNYLDISKARVKIKYLKSINTEIFIIIGNILNKIKQPEEAVKAFKNAININFYKTNCHNKLGITLMNLERYKEAYESFKNAANINPKDAEYHYNLGSALIELKRYKEACKSLKNAVDINPENAEYHYSLAYACKECKDYNTAIDHFNKALELNPDDALAYSGLGYAHHECKEYNKAIDYFNKALDLNPDDALAYSGLGHAYHGRKEYDTAIDYFNKAFELDPDEVSAYYGLGNTYYERKEYNKAIDYFNKTLKLDPDYATAYCNLGYAHYKCKKYSKAINYFNKACELDPDGALAYSGLGYAHYKYSEYNKAIDYFNKALELDPDEVSAYYGLGCTYNARKECNKAINYFTKTLDLNPDGALAYSGLGHAYSERKEYNKAINYFNKARKLDPDEVSAYYGLGYIYNGNKEYDKAISYFNKTLKLNPDYVSAYCGLSLAYKGRKEYDKALEYLAQAIKLDPDSEYTYHLKKDLRIQDTLRIQKAVEKSAEDLAAIIQNHKSYQGYPTTTEAILMLCGSDGKKQFEREDLLYIEGILNGTKYRLRHYNRLYSDSEEVSLEANAQQAAMIPTGIESNNQPNKALTSEDLVTIQKEFLPKEYIEGSIGDPTEMAGFRNRPTFFPIIPGDGITDLGYQEWKKQCEEWNNDPTHKLYQIFRTKKDIDQEDIAMAMGNALAIIASDRKDEQQLKTAADCIFEMCNEGIKKAENDHEKLYYIACAINWLAKAQLLNDANCRTIAYGILPELLDRCGLEPVMIRAEEIPILKLGDICIIQHAIQFYQQRFKICKDNPKQFLEAIKEGTLTSFEAEFHKDRVDRETFFNNLYPGEKYTLKSLYDLPSLYQAMEETMKQIDTIAQKDVDEDKSGYYTIAKNIRKYIENFFIDRNYSKEAGMGSLHKIKEKSTYYGEFISLSNHDPRFRALGTLLERIQKFSKQATDQYLRAPNLTKIGPSSITSDNSYNQNSNKSVFARSEGSSMDYLRIEHNK